MYPHSFPPRRSSDLATRDVLVLVGHRAADPRSARPDSGHVAINVKRSRENRAPEQSANRRLPLHRRSRGPGPSRSRLGAPAHSDRKSTRLNSSHRCIHTLSLHVALPIWRRVTSSSSLAIALLTLAALGQTQDTLRLTLKEAEKTALQNNPQIAASRYTAEAAAQVPAEVGSALQPTQIGRAHV